MDEPLRLDGNAIAGLLSELFAFDATTARAVCAHCGTTRPVGALMVYASGIGTVVRCVACEGVLFRIVRIREVVRLDPQGLGCLEIGPETAGGSSPT